MTQRDEETAPAKPELWTCPKCGARLVQRNMWHACGEYSVEKFLEGKGPRARAMFDRFVDLVKACGPFEFAPAKTRVAFMVRVRFASINRISDRGMTAAFNLAREIASPRIHRVDHPAPKWYVHHFRVTSPEELDEEVLGWLKESYQMGEQRHLGRGKKGAGR